MDPFMLALRVLLALGAVVGVLWFIQKRVNGHQLKTRAGEPLTVVARRGVGANASVVVIDTGGQRFLLGVTEQSVNVLYTGDIPAPEPVVPAAPAPAGGAQTFADKLALATTAPVVGVTRDAELPGASPLTGSLFAPETWKQAAAALRKGPIR
jgi:flagellar protein FliO/FliZ